MSPRSEKFRAPMLVAIALSFLLTSCSQKTPVSPQQKFITALNRGNSAQAAQIWRNMTPEDRAAFTHGEGIAPTPDNAEVKKLMQKHFDENLPAGFHAENADSGVSIPDIPKGASLSDLPGYATQGAPPTPPGDSTQP